jgi:hypothetical protein
MIVALGRSQNQLKKKKEKKRDLGEREIKSKKKSASIPIEKAVGRRIN